MGWDGRWAGLLQKECRPADVLEDAAMHAASLCDREFGTAPELKVRERCATLCGVVVLSRVVAYSAHVTCTSHPLYPRLSGLRLEELFAWRRSTDLWG